MLSYRIVCILTCDRCGVVFPERFDVGPMAGPDHVLVSQAERRARALGWTDRAHWDHYRDYCPRCSESSSISIPE
jgi:hypothetical protein